jgi:hypothetical protein
VNDKQNFSLTQNNILGKLFRDHHKKLRYGHPKLLFDTVPVPPASLVDPDPHLFGNLDPHPHQIKLLVRIGIKVISWIRKLIRIRINLQMTSQNVWNISLF